MYIGGIYEESSYGVSFETSSVTHQYGVAQSTTNIDVP